MLTPSQKQYLLDKYNELYYQDITNLKNDYAENIYIILINNNNISIIKDNIEDKIYECLGKIYSMTVSGLEKIYNIELENKAPTETEIENLTYQKDGKNLNERIENYCNEYNNDKDKLFFYMIQILDTEVDHMFNAVVENKMKEEMDTVMIEGSNDHCNGNCAEYIAYGEVLIDEMPDLPPYHPNCNCIALYSSEKLEDMIDELMGE